MPESEGNEGQGGQQQNDGGNSGFTPPATQEELNRIITERVNRERAKFADYNDLKGKAAKFDELEQSSKSEADKAAERLAALEDRAARAEQDALRSRIQARHGISSEDADLFLTASDEATLNRQAEGLAQRAADRKNKGNRVSREGHNQSAGSGSDEREFVRELFGSGA